MGRHQRYEMSKATVALSLGLLTRVFLSLNHARYHCLPRVSINHACKNVASNPKKKRKTLQLLKGAKSLRHG